jgi:hypothetical protein
MNWIIIVIIIINTLVTYFEFTTHLVSSQRQDNATYFDLSNAFDLVRNALLHH